MLPLKLTEGKQRENYAEGPNLVFHYIMKELEKV